MTNGPATVSGLLAEARRRFQAAGLADAGIDARMLIGGLLGLSTTELLTGGEMLLSPEDTARIAAAVERRLAREPVHRILGFRAFHGLELKLSPATLEPRPDTEILVDAVLPHLNAFVEKNGEARLLDLGTGTGAIGLALLKECPQARAVLCDISEEALSVARDNAYINAVADRAETLKSDWFAEVDGLFDIIVSNPPYIVTDVIETLSPEVRDFDPRTALDGGPDGLDAYRAIARGAADHLRHDGIVALEIGYDQKDAVLSVYSGAEFDTVAAVTDYGGRDRVLVFRKRPA